jgi:hypothetical protein
MAPTPRLLSLAAILLLLAPGASASTVDVPEMVLQASVPFLVKDATAGSNVTMTVGLVSISRITTTSSQVFTVTGVANGWQAWAVTVDDGTPETFSGSVYVDGSISALSVQVAALQTALDTLEDKVEGTNATGLQSEANVTADLESVNKTVREILVALLTATTGGAPLPGNVSEAIRRATAESLGGSEAGQAALAADVAAVQDTTEEASASAASAVTWATYAAMAAAAAALLMICVGLFLFQQLQKNRQEFLVYVLALAAHSGITPQSPEFMHALEATGHVPKEKKVKAEKGPKKSFLEKRAEKKKAKAASKKKP